jgi:hypothetical protein
MGKDKTGKRSVLKRIPLLSKILKGGESCDDPLAPGSELAGKPPSTQLKPPVVTDASQHLSPNSLTTSEPEASPKRATSIPSQESNVVGSQGDTPAGEISSVEHFESNSSPPGGERIEAEIETEADGLSGGAQLLDVENAFSNYFSD